MPRMPAPIQRLDRMRKSSKKRSVLADDYAYFTTLVSPFPGVKLLVVGGTERAAIPRISETPSSDKTGD